MADWARSYTAAQDIFLKKFDVPKKKKGGGNSTFQCSTGATTFPYGQQGLKPVQVKWRK